MTSFSSLSSPLSVSALPAAEAPGPAGRALLALAVVFVLLATTGWSAVKGHESTPGPRAAAVLAWQKASAGGRQLPAPDASPRSVSEFFRSLDSAQRHRLAERHPLVVGNLDGTPVELRYRANRAALLDARERERERSHSPKLTDTGRHRAAERVQRLGSLLRPGRQILAFDPTGEGRAAEVFGDLRSADRVSVVVPGVDTELLNFERPDEPYRSPVGMARALQAEQHTTAPDARTATVAWADYTTPAGLGVDAASATLARKGAERLTGFVRGLPSGSRVGLFCHSYGSVTCGVAADDLPRRVSDIAVAGSPGMRAEEAGELGTTARIWAMRDGGDWIADVPHVQLAGLGHGADPYTPAFGARRLASDGARGHAGYFVPGTASLANLAAVGAGERGETDCASPAPGGCAADPAERA